MWNGVFQRPVVGMGEGVEVNLTSGQEGRRVLTNRVAGWCFGMGSAVECGCGVFMDGGRILGGCRVQMEMGVCIGGVERQNRMLRPRVIAFPCR